MHKIRLKAGEIASIVSGKLIGDPELILTALSEPHEASSDAVCFITSKSAISLIEKRSPGLLIIPNELESEFSTPRLLVPKTSLAMAKFLEHLFPPSRSNGIINPKAFVANSARLGESVEVMAGAHIGEGVEIGEGTIIFPNVVIGEDVKIGSGCRIYPSVTIYHRCIIGDRVTLHAGVVIGADGFGYTQDEAGHRKIPQIGNVIIEDDVEIGSNSTVDRATLGSTKIGRGSKIDDQVMIGHNCQIGPFTIICAQVGIAGSTNVGKGVVMAGKAGIGDHLNIGDGATIGPFSGVGKDVDPGARVLGTLPYPEKIFLKSSLYFSRLPEVFRRLKMLEDENIKKSRPVSNEKALDHSQRDSL